MQPTRRSSRLLMLKDVVIDPLYGSNSALRNSRGDSSGSQAHSQKRLLRHDTRAVTPPPPEQEVESLSYDELFDDDAPDEPPVPLDTAENRSKEQRYEESQSVFQTKAQCYPELM